MSREHSSGYADPDDPDAGARLRREAVASVRLLLEAFDAERSS